jgi:DNA end-binding protein Ku
MAAEKRDTLDLTEFVPVSEIDPLHVEKTYYTNPDKGMDKQFTIMREALKQENKAAIGTWVSRGKEHLVAIRAHGDNLLVHQMFYDTEIRAHESKCKPYTPTAIDLAMSKLLIDHLSKDKFNKSQYSDKFADQLSEAVETKLAGGEIKKTEASLSGLTNMAETIRASLLAMGVPEDQIAAMVAKAEAEAGAAKAPALAEQPKAKKTRGRKKATKKAANA